MLRIAQQVSERKVEKMNMNLWKSRENEKRKNKVRKNDKEIKCHDRRKKKKAWLVMEAGKQIKQIKVKKVWEKETKRKLEGLKETDGRDKLNVTRAVKRGKDVRRKQQNETVADAGRGGRSDRENIGEAGPHLSGRRRRRRRQGTRQQSRQEIRK